MIIDSPVGRFPFVVTGITMKAGHLHLHGEMGAWPTSVEVTPSDVPRVLARVLPRPSAAAGGAALLGAVAVAAGLTRARRAR